MIKTNTLSDLFISWFGCQFFFSYFFFAAFISWYPYVTCTHDLAIDIFNFVLVWNHLYVLVFMKSFIPLSCRWCRSTAKGLGNLIWDEEHWCMPKHHNLLCSFSGKWKVITFLCMFMQFSIIIISFHVAWSSLIYCYNSYQKGWSRSWPQAFFSSKTGFCCSKPCNVPMSHRWLNRLSTSLVVHQETWRKH